MPSTSTSPASPPSVGSVATVLAAIHPIYASHEAGWRRDERRFYGGDAVLDESSELPIWKGEDDDHRQQRIGEAEYLNFGQIHATTLMGHLERARPLPGSKDFSLGTLGEVRPRSAIPTPSLGESFYFNVDGVGMDGSEFPAWVAGVHERAFATGHRWVLVEMPSLADIRGVAARARPTAQATQADVAIGFRPYAVEFSPLEVPYWEIDRGRLDVAVVRVLQRPSIALGTQTAGWRRGYYLLVRQGFQGLGEAYAGGGWWLYDYNRTPVLDAEGRPAQGTWDRTRGQVPLIPCIGDDSTGTFERPAMSRSLTMELGQLSVGLMRMVSARNYNAISAAKAVNYILGTDPKNPDGFNLTVQMHEQGALVVPVPAYEKPDGSGMAIPQIWNSAAAAVPATVFQGVIDAILREAHEIMVRQVTSTADSSGASKRAGFTEHTSPLLARLASHRQRFENALIAFAELRAGAVAPTGFSIWPRDFQLRPLVDEINAMFETLDLGAVSSPSMRVNLAIAALKARDLMTAGTEEGADPAAIEATYREELGAGIAQQATSDKQAASLLTEFNRTRKAVPASDAGAVA